MSYFFNVLNTVNYTKHDVRAVSQDMSCHIFLISSHPIIIWRYLKKHLTM